MRCHSETTSPFSDPFPPSQETDITENLPLQAKKRQDPLSPGESRSLRWRHFRMAPRAAYNFLGIFLLLPGSQNLLKNIYKTSFKKSIHQIRQVYQIWQLSLSSNNFLLSSHKYLLVFRNGVLAVLALFGKLAAHLWIKAKKRKFHKAILGDQNCISFSSSKKRDRL